MFEEDCRRVVELRFDIRLPFWKCCPWVAVSWSSEISTAMRRSNGKPHHHQFLVVAELKVFHL